MLTLELFDGGTISLDPRYIVSVSEGTRAALTKSLLSGSGGRVNVVYITVVNGYDYCILDPNGAVAAQIKAAKGR